jgi:hypothetical protein
MNLKLNVQTIHWHFIDLCTIVLFDITQYTNIVVHDEIDGNTLSTETTRTTNPNKKTPNFFSKQSSKKTFKIMFTPEKSWLWGVGLGAMPLSDT